MTGISPFITTVNRPYPSYPTGGMLVSSNPPPTPAAPSMPEPQRLILPGETANQLFDPMALVQKTALPPQYHASVAKMLQPMSELGDALKARAQHLPISLPASFQPKQLSQAAQQRYTYAVEQTHKSVKEAKSLPITAAIGGAIGMLAGFGIALIATKKADHIMNFISAATGLVLGAAGTLALTYFRFQKRIANVLLKPLLPQSNAAQNGTAKP